MQVRVELLARLGVALQAQLGGHGLQSVADRLEAPRELVVLTGAPDVVQDRQQFADDLGGGHLADGHAVALDALAVVRVLGLDSLDVVGEFDDPLVGVDRLGHHGLRGVGDLDGLLGLGGLVGLRGGLGRLGVADLARLRVDPAVVADHRSPVLLTVGAVGLVRLRHL
ncbi:hypothetical protein BJF83_14930 [Nocardiopsis sp. CNR-923]|nr:hypothetical protein BJF83_14930 [Nocardiopsis sp. CNR-923]